MHKEFSLRYASMIHRKKFLVNDLKAENGKKLPVDFKSDGIIIRHYLDKNTDKVVFAFVYGFRKYPSYSPLQILVKRKALCVKFAADKRI